MKVRDLLGAVRDNMVFEVEYRSDNWRICTGPNNSYELDRVFGDREVSDWFPLGSFGVICVDMVPLEEEADDEAD